MTLPLVTQLHFARSEFVRSMAGLTDDDARHRFEPMNCISWMIGHLAAQENFYWVRMAQGKSCMLIYGNWLPLDNQPAHRL